ncbi:hypothetical protein KIN20_034789 [Parelaphostrongylus tenuis]|uniref:Protein kinase domain-containing protein n=1 Tax=Parelaphostrongylus tenuis TaxID=148309 RepID=A0AAD5RA78_PARTN|nr:hypothetical protein KIN20_034789 [Parelaphostrongylus tenuis]
MSRRLYGQNDYYRMQNHCLLPVRWLPPEAITDHKFSTSSDVWALGVTIWEVFSYGEVPFAELNNFEMVSYAMAGMRPPRPKSCPVAMYELMKRCWSIVPDDRIRPEEALLDPCFNTNSIRVHQCLSNVRTVANHTHICIFQDHRKVATFL